jgi:hypothetical protein
VIIDYRKEAEFDGAWKLIKVLLSPNPCKPQDESPHDSRVAVRLLRKEQEDE